MGEAEDSAAWFAHLDSTTQGTETESASRRTSLPALTVLAHPNPARWGERALLPGLFEGRSIELSRRQPLFARPGATPTEDEGMPLADPRLSRRPLVLSPAGPAGIRLDASGVRSRVELDGEPLEEAGSLPWSRLESGVDLVLAGQVVLLLHAVPAELAELADQAEAGASPLVGASPAMVRLRRRVARVARHGFPVLLRGETGTGKELAARAIHEASPRRSGPFVAVNMAAIPGQLAAAELFGARRGAFTGARSDRHGFFQRARGGTLFLDEIGEAGSELQALLLRALDAGEVQPVGASQPESTDVRIVAATDAPLEAAVEEGTFKSPLLFRLSTHEISLPPLRRRRDDVPRLFRHFLQRELGSDHELFRDRGPGARPWIPARLLRELAMAPWPGNVRQLLAVTRRLVVEGGGRDELCLTGELFADLHAAGESVDEPKQAGLYRQAEEIDDPTLLEALRSSAWSPARAAKALGISRGTLYRLMDRSSTLRKASDIGRDELMAAREEHGGEIEAMAAALEVSAHGLRLRLAELENE